MEAEIIMQYKPLIKDKNSISSILSVLRQHIEKRKVFGESNAQDFKYIFVINSIKGHFDCYRNQAREMFQKFVRMCIEDEGIYINNLVTAMSANLATLKYQESLIEEKIKVAQTQISFVSMMRKTKARSQFMYHKSLGLKIYYFTPYDHVELVEEHQKSQWSKNYQEYIDNEKIRKQKMEDRKKSSAILEEKMKQPL